jgi:hypothetical protein
MKDHRSLNPFKPFQVSLLLRQKRMRPLTPSLGQHSFMRSQVLKRTLKMKQWAMALSGVFMN